MAAILRATYKILEATNPGEYAELSAANKAVYQLIISAGRVDISEGTTVRNVLWGMFGANSVTRENLEGLYPGPDD